MVSGYIKPLDGMRAIAILLVLIFHLDHSLLPGGFIGVDIFFVVSGYIITRNILVQQAGGSFSFSEFYKRRLVRLFPASAVTVVLTLMVSAIIYDPQTVAGVGRTSLYALLSVANIWFWLNSGYFDDASSQNPLLHMWSLSVEEQFYLIWPALLVGLALLPGRKVIWLAAVFAVGVAGAWWWATVDPSGAFYLMPARIFQFAIGAVVATIAVRPSATIGLASLLAGLVLVGVSAAFSNGDAYNFLIAALVPALGGALAIFGLQTKAGEVLLGNAPMRAIGLRAYSIYLVHWPIAVFAGTLMGPNRSLLENSALFILCLAAGDLLYRTVEKPLRIIGAPAAGGKDSSVLKVSATMLLVAGSLAVSAHVWALNTRPEPAQEILAEGVTSPAVVAGDDPAEIFWARAEQESIPAQVARMWKERVASSAETGKGACSIQHKAAFSTYPEASCRMVDEAGPKYLLVGDSLGSEALIAIDALIPAKKIAVASTLGCLPEYPEPGWDVRPEGCQELNRRRFEWLSTDEFDGVIMAANWRWINKERFATMVSYLKAQEKPLIFFGPRPAFSEAVPGLLSSIAGKAAADDLDRYLSYDFKEKGKELLGVLEESGIQYVYVPWGEMLCPDVCRAYNSDGEMIYLDLIHAPPSINTWLGTKIAKDQGPEIRRLFDLD